MKQRLTLLFLFLCFISVRSTITAQDKLPIKFGKLSPADFNIQSPLIDSGTSAVVVAEAGKTEFVANAHELTFSLLFKANRRVKIINKNGFDAATVVIPLYVSDNGKAEKLEGLTAYTYNLEGDKVQATKVDKASVFTEQHSKNIIYKKFTFPALKEGSIIEYSYEVKSDFFFNLQPWSFQGAYPVLWSQYEAAIPEFFNYVVLTQGYQPFFIDNNKRAQTSFSFVEHADLDVGRRTRSSDEPRSNNFKLDGAIDYHTWVKKDVPALREEPFTTTLRNSIAKIEFQLKEVVFPNSLPTRYMNTWEKVSADLLSHENFGLPVNRANNWLDGEVEAIVKNTASTEQKARKIFEYVRDNYTTKDQNSFYITTGLKEVVKNKSGSAADINMLLIAMLRNQQLNANPVILSTRDHGVTSEYYPLMERYNYVVARLYINDDIYYLDAATKFLGFNRLPEKVYNGHARVINKEATPVFFIADSLQETSNKLVFIVNNDKDEIEGKLTDNMGFYQSLDLREQLAASGLQQYIKNRQKDYPEDITLLDMRIDSLNKYEEPVSVQYDLQIKGFGESDIVYFNPMMGEAIRKNPFAAADRFYPVEMPYTIDDTYTINMDVPKGYEVDELPKSVRMMFNEDEGMFEYLMSGNKEFIQLRCKLQLKKATYTNEDYQSLREFFAFVVKKQAEQVVFKKIK